MNERIKELDKQAKLWAMDNTNFPISSHIPAGYTEKFAELIIQDCTKVCADNGMRAGGAGTIVGETFLDASKLIRGNFGLDTFGLY